MSRSADVTMGNADKIIKLYFTSLTTNTITNPNPNPKDMIQLYKYVTNKYGVNFKLKLDYQSMFKMSYDTGRNIYKLIAKLCKYELRKQFFVNRVVRLWNIQVQPRLSRRQVFRTGATRVSAGSNSFLDIYQ